MLQRRHFEQMAAYIRDITKAGAPFDNIEGAKDLALYMGRLSNPRFDEARFRKACKVPESGE